MGGGRFRELEYHYNRIVSGIIWYPNNGEWLICRGGQLELYMKSSFNKSDKRQFKNGVYDANAMFGDCVLKELFINMYMHTYLYIYTYIKSSFRKAIYKFGIGIAKRKVCFV